MTIVSLLDHFERAIGLLSGDDVPAAPTAGGGVGADETSSSVTTTRFCPPENDAPPSRRAVAILEDLQQQVAEKGVFSSNEPLKEMSTASLPLLAVEHYLALGWTRVPWLSPSVARLPQPEVPSISNSNPTTNSPAAAAATAAVTPDPRSRRANLLRACDLWCSFLRRLEGLEALSSTETRQLDDLEELLTMHRGDGQAPIDGVGGVGAPGTGLMRGMGPPPMLTRDEKIARFKARQELAAQQERLKSLRERRVRLGAKDDDELDGYDGDGLARSFAITALNLAKADALDELGAAIQELPMVTMMIQAQEQQQGRSTRADPSGRDASSRSSADHHARTPAHAQPLQVTRVTKDAFGQLQVKREEIRSGVFRPGWNQPTQTLEELAEREVRDALEREERQRAAEADALRGPRRYDQLAKDGMEDDADLVDASAALDRKWDDWKDENPRGSGNKRGDVGDRNF